MKKILDVVGRRRFLFLLFLIFMAQAHYTAYGQSKNLTFTLKNASLKEVISELKRLGGYDFVYRDANLETVPRRDVHYQGVTLNQVMEDCLKGSNLEYTVNGQTIVIKKRAEQQVQEMRKVTGKVTDEQGMPLPGVTVILKGTSLGTATDMEGKYQLNVPASEGTTLVFSFVGMKTQEVTVGKSSVIDVTLESDSETMEEVVVTGIFKKAKESYTGAVSSIDKEQLKIYKGQNLLQTLKNIDVSLNMAVDNINGSNPNRMPQINIRGNSSLPMSVQEYNESLSNDVNTPLIILDGFEIKLERLMDYNDEEIESINLLKDAAATAIYGSRGSNGVIVVTTKQPEAGKLRVNAEVGLDLEVPDLTSYDLLNAKEKLELENSLGLYSSKRPDRDMALQAVYNERLRRVLSGMTTDWIDKPIRTGVGQHYNLRLEGGSEQFRWSATTNFKDVQGAMKNSSRKTFNGSITLMYSLKNLTFKNYTSYGVSRSRESNYGSFSDYVAQQPYNSPYDENGNLREKLESFDKTPTGAANPLYDASLNTKDKQGYEELTNNFSIEWKILNSLTLRGQFGITTQNSHSDYFLPKEHSYFTTNDVYQTEEGFFRRGKYQYGSGNSLTTNGNITLAYNKLFNDKHSLYVGFDYSVAGAKSTSLDFVVEGFSNGEMNFIGNAHGYEKDGVPRGRKANTRRLGFTGNVNYTFDNRYYVDASFRVDGSSTFGSDKKYAPFWSTGIGWNLHNEQFLKGNEILNILRLKASYGQTGSQQGSGSGASTLYVYQTGSKYMNWSGSVLSEWGNPKLTWQTTDEFNVGTEIGILQSRIKAEFAYYFKTTDNLLSNMDLPSSMGINTYMANVGAVKNRGWEASLTTYIIRDPEREFNWMVSGQLTYNKNWISKLSAAIKAQNEAYLNMDAEDVPEVATLFEEGRPQNAIYAVRSLGIDPSTGNEIFLDRDGNIAENWKAGYKVYMGSKDPLYRGNLNTMVMWKGFTFNVSFGYYWGGKIYNQTLVDRVEVTKDAIRTSNVDRRVYNDRWQKPGDVAFFKGFSNDATRATSRFVMDDNVLELQSASLQYRWDSEWLRKQTHLQSVTFGVNMSDLFHWGSVRQERGTTYPFARNIQGSIKILF